MMYGLGGYAHGYGYGCFGSGYGLGAPFMMFLGLVAVVGVVLLVAWLTRHTASAAYPPYGHGATNASFEIARERYARGEITKEQFEEIRRTVL